MCYAASCNPVCGQCRPRRIVQVICPNCGAPNEMTREEFLIVFDLPHRQNIVEKKLRERGTMPQPICRSCGQDLKSEYQAAVPPSPCLNQQVICGFPCGRSVDPKTADTVPCPTVVPLGRLP